MIYRIKIWLKRRIKNEEQDDWAVLQERRRIKGHLEKEKLRALYYYRGF